MDTLLNISLGSMIVIGLVAVLIAIAIFAKSFYLSIQSNRDCMYSDNIVRTYNIYELVKATGKTFSECERAYDSIKDFDLQIEHLQKD